MKSEEKVKKYFENGAENFDRIYDWIYGSDDKSLKLLVNKIFRKGMIARFKQVLEECEPDKNILDIGCGSGRIDLALAKKGANIIGIDYSKQMIELANKYLNKYQNERNITLNVKFLHKNFMKNYRNKELFDITLAIGVFDYIKEPIPFLKKMRNLSKEKIIASYPAKFTFQMPIRTVWLWTKRCPVYFYTKYQIKSMYESINLFNYEIVKIPAGYIVKAYKNN
ncbi:MAG: class I SAM-dependent methyltransferase [Candidatus Hodarchaeota archaeon]